MYSNNLLLSFLCDFFAQVWFLDSSTEENSEWQKIQQRIGSFFSGIIFSYLLNFKWTIPNFSVNRSDPNTTNWADWINKKLSRESLRVSRDQCSGFGKKELIPNFLSELVALKKRYWFLITKWLLKLPDDRYISISTRWKLVVNFFPFLWKSNSKREVLRTIHIFCRNYWVFLMNWYQYFSVTLWLLRFNFFRNNHFFTLLSFLE